MNAIFIGSSNELGAFESGTAARLIGTVPSVVFGGLATLLVVATTALKVPELRRLREIRAADSRRWHSLLRARPQQLGQSFN